LPASQVNAVLARLAKATENHAGYKLLCIYAQIYLCGSLLSSYPGLLIPACSTNAGEGLVNLSHV